MEIQIASRTLSILGHPGRLAAFRLLMRFAPSGSHPTEMAQALGVRLNTLSGQLADLEQTGLITAERKGRSILYRANLTAASEIIAYLVNDCCRGRPDIRCPSTQLMEDLMTTRPFNVLFICSGNSARSIFAEAILRDVGAGRFNAYSAGTRPGTALNPYAVEVLQRSDHDVSGLRSKDLSEFQTPDAPKMDFVFTVCDIAASEECAPWPGQPLSAHWGVPDPVKAEGNEAEKGLAFARAYGELRRRIIAFAALPVAELEKVALQQHLDHIGSAG
jgi:arsenate reductase